MRKKEIEESNKSIQNIDDSTEIDEKNLDNEKETKKPKSKAKKIIDKILSLVILIACICGLIYSGSKLYTWLLNNINSNSVINEVNDIAGVSDVDDDEDPGAEFGLDFESLLAYNSDVVGWIRIPGTGVNYALVQTDNNSTYLRTSLDGTYNQFGWPFVDYKNSSDFTDENTVIYGHNIVSGLMFADLIYIWNGTLGTDVTIYIYKPDYTMLTYKVFSTYIYDPEQYYVTTYFSSDEQFTTYLNTMVARSVRTYSYTVGSDDNIITLSTCTSDAKRRIVVHAKLISSTEMPR